MVSELMGHRVREYLSDVPVGISTLPRIYPPASDQELLSMEVRAEQSLDVDYREFLSLTDGMDGFYLSHCVFGCRDWSPGGRAVDAIEFRNGTIEDGTPEDVGLPGDLPLFPVSINSDASQAIFMIDCPEFLPERFWWIGEGDSMFFHRFSDLLAYALDPHSYSPRETIE